MKCSETWLRQWVDPKLNRDKLCRLLTMSGFEVEEVLPAKELGSTEAGYVIDISITPNRGDCLSIRGMAREVAAITKTRMKAYKPVNVKPTNKAVLPIHIKAKAECPRYVGRIIQNINANAVTPKWLKNRLLASGMNSISPIVDVTNYVMLELGQPMHAFDLNTIEKEINVRLSKKGEKITLLDGSEKTLDASTLVIADKHKPLAIAGVMGGADSSVTLTTTDILLESAFFSPMVVARQRQHFGLNTDSSYRFERSIDPSMQREAIERATQLLLEITGGKPGPVIEVCNKAQLPKMVNINVSDEKIESVLGIKISAKHIQAIFKALNFKFKQAKTKWMVEAPPYRSDLKLAEDLIEEVARLYGYDNIPTLPITSTLGIKNGELGAPTGIQRARELIADLGYNEIVSYSFVDNNLQVLLEPNVIPLELANPITADMTVMRTNLWPGLINAHRYNKSRQQQRIRLFEFGTCFYNAKGKLEQENRLAGIIAGSVTQEQWGATPQEVDFFDLKGDLENLLHDLGVLEACTFKQAVHPALHPGQSAAIFYHNKQVGVLGALHPEKMQALDLPDKTFLFELKINYLLDPPKRHFNEISKFPEIRRDIAILLNQTVPSDKIQDTIRQAAGAWLKEVFIFDVYQGKGVSPGKKSLALALILQHPSRTLIDEEAIALTERVITALKGQHGAELRS